MEVIDGGVDHRVKMSQKPFEVISLDEPFFRLGNFCLEESLGVLEESVEVLIPESFFMDFIVKTSELVDEIVKASSFLIVEKVKIHCLQLLCTSNQSLTGDLPVDHDVRAIS